ncbi:glycosyltransferase family 4 protein [Pseudidiomarina salilacus]|uniref:glycosyltransferase family 4 protein n=1 Tax=Pseudidiomarina salilacus TaxID=3384452 RepID=UPI003984F46A
MTKKVLYVTPPWYGFDKMIFDGAREVSGLPSFSYPLQKLVEDGCEVDCLLIRESTDNRVFNLKAKWLKKINFFSVFYDSNLVSKLTGVYRIRRIVKVLITRNDYDFVYLHGTTPAIVTDIVRRMGVPVAQRLYGTFLWEQIKKRGFYRAILTRWFEFKAFTVKKEFLMVTNDGSGGDKVVEKIFRCRRPPFDFYHLYNGVRAFDETLSENTNDDFGFLSDKPFLLCVGRFDAWKNQHLVVEILASLRQRGFDLNLLFIGPHDTLGDNYFKFVSSTVRDFKLTDRVFFLGHKSPEYIAYAARKSLCVLSLNDVCNVTSVFHEMLSCGAALIVKKGEDVEKLISHRVNGFLVNDVNDATDTVIELINSRELQNRIRNNGKHLSQSYAMSWDDRARLECDLIYSVIDNCTKNSDI